MLLKADDYQEIYQIYAQETKPTNHILGIQCLAHFLSYYNVLPDLKTNTFSFSQNQQDSTWYKNQMREATEKSFQQGFINLPQLSIESPAFALAWRCDNYSMNKKLAQHFKAKDFNYWELIVDFIVQNKTSLHSFKAPFRALKKDPSLLTHSMAKKLHEVLDKIAHASGAFYEGYKLDLLEYMLDNKSSFDLNQIKFNFAQTITATDSINFKFIKQFEKIKENLKNEDFSSLEKDFPKVRTVFETNKDSTQKQAGNAICYNLDFNQITAKTGFAITKVRDSLTIGIKLLSDTVKKEPGCVFSYTEEKNQILTFVLVVDKNMPDNKLLEKTEGFVEILVENCNKHKSLSKNEYEKLWSSFELMLNLNQTLPEKTVSIKKIKI